MRELRNVPGFPLAFAVFVLAMLIVLFTHQLREGVFFTYYQAAKNMSAHIDPYPKGGMEFDVGYKYSPLFTVLFRPFAAVQPQAGHLLWRLLNLAAFLYGLCYFLTRGAGGRSGLASLLDRPYKTAILLALVFNETSLSLKAGQANPLVCGGLLLGLALYSEGREATAGIVLAVVSNFKIYPLALALLLLWDFRSRYWTAFLGASVLALALPAVALGWDWNWEMTLAWFKTLFTDFGTESKLSLMKFLEVNFGFEGKSLYRAFVALNVALLCACYRYSCSGRTAEGAKVLYPLAALFILLFNHRTETELFILVSPVYALLFLRILEEKSQGRNAAKEIVFLALGFFFITLLYTDLAPDNIGSWAYEMRSRAVGALVLYVYFAGLAARKTLIRILPARTVTNPPGPIKSPQPPFTKGKSGKGE